MIKYWVIILLLLQGCGSDKTSSETTVLCTTNITQSVGKNQVTEIPLEENQKIVAVEEVQTPDGIEEFVTIATYEYYATVSQCNDNGGIADNDIVGNETK